MTTDRYEASGGSRLGRKPLTRQMLTFCIALIFGGLIGMGAIVTLWWRELVALLPGIGVLVCLFAIFAGAEKLTRRE